MHNCDSLRNETLRDRISFVIFLGGAIAQTIVQLGIDLKKVKTTARLQDAIASVIKT